MIFETIHLNKARKQTYNEDENRQTGIGQSVVKLYLAYSTS